VSGATLGITLEPDLPSVTCSNGSQTTRRASLVAVSCDVQKSTTASFLHGTLETSEKSLSSLSEQGSSALVSEPGVANLGRTIVDCQLGCSGVQVS